MLEIIQKFFTIPYQWTFDLVGFKAILFSVYMGITFGLPISLGFIICACCSFVSPDGKDKSITRVLKYTLIIMLIATIQFFVVLGIGNLITIK